MNKGKDLTILPLDFITAYKKGNEWVYLDNDGNYVCEILSEEIPLVRCKDCKHWNRERAKRAKIQFMGYCERFCGYCNKTDYCAWAERKDNE